MLRRLSLRDFVIVPALELDFGAGFAVLTGETGAGKSILIAPRILKPGSSKPVSSLKATPCCCAA